MLSEDGFAAYIPWRKFHVKISVARHRISFATIGCTADRRIGCPIPAESRLDVIRLDSWNVAFLVSHHEKLKCHACERPPAKR